MQRLWWDAPMWTYLLLSASAAACLHPGPAHTRGRRIQPPLTSCGCASIQRESAGDKKAGCSSRGTRLLAAAQCARPHHLEAITCRCSLLTQLSRVQLTCSFLFFRLKVVHEATLGRWSLKQLISVYNLWVITRSLQPRVSSLLDTFTAANRKQPIRSASEEKCNFGALFNHLRELLSLLWL